MLLLLTLLLFTGTVRAEQRILSLLSDVAMFAEDRKLCDHFRGEEPYDAERRAFLEEKMLKLCTGTDQKLAELKIKYAHNPEVMSVLNQYKVNIEPHSRQ